MHSTFIKTVCSEVHLSTTEPESLTGIITKPKQNRKRVEPDDATVTVLVVDGRGQQDIRECTADENQPQQKGSRVVVGDPSSNHLRKREGREREKERERHNRDRRQKKRRKQRKSKGQKRKTKKGEKRQKQRTQTERTEKEEKDQELDSYTLVHALHARLLSSKTLPLKCH